MIDDEKLDEAEVLEIAEPTEGENEPLLHKAEPQAIDRSLLKKVIQGALLAAGMPLSIDKLRSLFDPEVDIEPARTDMVEILEEIAAECAEAGFELVEVGTGWRFQVRAETARWVNRLWDEKPQKYSRALLETLSLIAYRQPITRGDIEEIRGVAVSSHIIKTLTERDWVKVVGHRDVPGRPSLYATTRQFLDYFNLKSLEELPSLSEIADFDKLDPELGLALGDESDLGMPDDDCSDQGVEGNADDSSEIDLESAEAFMNAVADGSDEGAVPSADEPDEEVEGPEADFDTDFEADSRSLPSLFND